MDETLDALVRRVDEDRWFAARFAAKAAIPRLMALYAVNHEIAKTALNVRESALGEMRLTWWAEAIEKALNGAGASDHPALQALAAAHGETPFAFAPFEAMIEARSRDLGEAPFETWADLERYVDDTAGGLITLAFAACGEPDAVNQNMLRASARACGRAWGFAALVRALPAWSARRSTFFPVRLMAHVGLDKEALFAGKIDHAGRSAAMALLDRSRNYFRQAKDLGASLPPTLFPAIAYLNALRFYLRAPSAPTMQESVSAPALLRKASLVLAVATGRL